VRFLVSKSYVMLFTLLVTVWITAACGGGSKTGEGQQGGDHVPELETFSLASLPKGAESAGAQPTLFETSRQIRRFAHFKDIYRICLAEGFSDAELDEFQARLSVKPGPVNSHGLEAAIGWVFAHLERLAAGRTKVSVRPELHVVRTSSGEDCDVVFHSAGDGEFPFLEERFSDRQEVLFYQGQLRNGSEGNRMAVGFVRGETLPPQRLRSFEYLVGVWLGFGESSEAHSRLSGSTRAEDPLIGLNLVNAGSNTPRMSQDTTILLTWALAFHDVLRPRDLDSFHYYNDRIVGNHATEVDPLLFVPEGSVESPYRALVGDKFLFGWRELPPVTRVCVQDADFAFSDEERSRMFEWAVLESVSGSDSGLFTHLAEMAKRRSKLFDRGLEIATDQCHLIVALRSSDQYPFSTRNMNALFVAGRASGGPAPIPVIYLNASVLTLDQPAIGPEGKRLMGDALQHEFAHYLGFKHSTDQGSILAPSGVSSRWRTDGADGKALERWLDVAGF
jgi:hypothetical protein